MGGQLRLAGLEPHPGRIDPNLSQLSPCLFFWISKTEAHRVQGELPFLSLVTSYKLIIRKSQHLFRNSNFPTSTPSLSKQDINISLFRNGKILNIIIHSTHFATSDWLQSPTGVYREQYTKDLMVHVYLLLNLAFIWYEEFCWSRRLLCTSVQLLDLHY